MGYLLVFLRDGVVLPAQVRCQIQWERITVLQVHVVPDVWEGTGATHGNDKWPTKQNRTDKQENVEYPQCSWCQDCANPWIREQHAPRDPHCCGIPQLPPASVRRWHRPPEGAQIPSTCRVHHIPAHRDTQTNCKTLLCRRQRGKRTHLSSVELSFGNGSLGRLDWNAYVGIGLLSK
jgi:hypothetical protein